MAGPIRPNASIRSPPLPETDSARPPVVVAGAGIGGLTAALRLARAGHRVAVLERAPVIEEVGAGLQIAPNAGRILQGLGLGEALGAAALLPEAINIHRARDGAVLSRLSLAGASERWGAPFRLFHRADLQQLLLAAARQNDAISIRTGTRVGDFEEGDGAVFLRVHTGIGPEDFEAMALVGADGVRSSVRSFLNRGAKDAPAYSGHTAWRAILPANAVPATLRRRETHLWLSAGAHVVHYPLRDASIISAVVIVEDGLSRAWDKGPASLGGADLMIEAGLRRQRRRIAGADRGGRLLAALAAVWPPGARPLEPGRGDAARRRRASDAAFSGAGRGDGDRGRRGAGPRFHAGRRAGRGFQSL